MPGRLMGFPATANVRRSYRASVCQGVPEAGGKAGSGPLKPSGQAVCVFDFHPLVRKREMNGQREEESASRSDAAQYQGCGR